MDPLSTNMQSAVRWMPVAIPVTPGLGSAISPGAFPVDIFQPSFPGFGYAPGFVNPDLGMPGYPDPNLAKPAWPIFPCPGDDRVPCFYDVGFQDRPGAFDYGYGEGDQVNLSDDAALTMDEDIRKLSPRGSMTSLADSFAKISDDGFVTADSLTNAVNDPSLSPDVRNAAARMLGDKLMFRAVDGVHSGVAGTPGGKEDGKVSEDDLRRALDLKAPDGSPFIPEEDRGDEARMHLTTLLDGFDTMEKGGKNGKGKGSGDGVVGIGEIDQICNDPGVSPEMREAAKFLKDNPYYLASIDNAQDGNQKDGKLVKGDFAAALDQLGGPLYPDALAPR